MYTYRFVLVFHTREHILHSVVARTRLELSWVFIMHLVDDLHVALLKLDLFSRWWIILSYSLMNQLHDDCLLWMNSI